MRKTINKKFLKQEILRKINMKEKEKKQTSSSHKDTYLSGYIYALMELYENLEKGFWRKMKTITIIDSTGEEYELEISEYIYSLLSDIRR